MEGNRTQTQSALEFPPPVADNPNGFNASSLSALEDSTVLRPAKDVQVEVDPSDDVARAQELLRELRSQPEGGRHLLECLRGQKNASDNYYAQQKMREQRRRRRLEHFESSRQELEQNRPNGLMNSHQESGQPPFIAPLQHQAPSTANHALQDYQMQLMLLEQQNKKRLVIGRPEQERTEPLQSTSEEPAAYVGKPDIPTPSGASAEVFDFTEFSESSSSSSSSEDGKEVSSVAEFPDDSKSLFGCFQAELGRAVSAPSTQPDTNGAKERVEGAPTTQDPSSDSSLPEVTESQPNPAETFAHVIRSVVEGISNLATDLVHGLPEAEARIRNIRDTVPQNMERVFRDAFQGFSDHVEQLAKAAQDASDFAKNAAEITRDADLRAVEGIVNGFEGVAADVGRLGQGVLSLGARGSRPSNVAPKNGDGAEIAQDASPFEAGDLSGTSSPKDVFSSHVQTLDVPPNLPPKDQLRVSNSEGEPLSANFTGLDNVFLTSDAPPTPLTSSTTFGHGPTTLIEVGDDIDGESDHSSSEHGSQAPYLQRSRPSGSNSSRASRETHRYAHHPFLAGESPYERRADVYRGRHSRRLRSRTMNDPLYEYVDPRLDTEIGLWGRVRPPHHSRRRYRHPRSRSPMRFRRVRSPAPSFPVEPPQFGQHGPIHLPHDPPALPDSPTKKSPSSSWAKWQQQQQTASAPKPGGHQDANSPISPASLAPATSHAAPGSLGPWQTIPPSGELNGHSSASRFGGPAPPLPLVDARFPPPPIPFDGHFSSPPPPPPLPPLKGQPPPPQAPLNGPLRLLPARGFPPRVDGQLSSRPLTGFPSPYSGRTQPWHPSLRPAVSVSGLRSTRQQPRQSSTYYEQDPLSSLRRYRSFAAPSWREKLSNSNLLGDKNQGSTLKGFDSQSSDEDDVQTSRAELAWGYQRLDDAQDEIKPLSPNDPTKSEDNEAANNPVLINAKTTEDDLLASCDDIKTTGSPVVETRNLRRANTTGALRKIARASEEKDIMSPFTKQLQPTFTERENKNSQIPEMTRFPSISQLEGRESRHSPLPYIAALTPQNHSDTRNDERKVSRNPFSSTPWYVSELGKLAEEGRATPSRIPGAWPPLSQMTEHNSFPSLLDTNSIWSEGVSGQRMDVPVCPSGMSNSSELEHAARLAGPFDPLAEPFSELASTRKRVLDGVNRSLSSANARTSNKAHSNSRRPASEFIGSNRRMGWESFLESYEHTPGRFPLDDDDDNSSERRAESVRSEQGSATESQARQSRPDERVVRFDDQPPTIIDTGSHNNVETVSAVVKCVETLKSLGFGSEEDGGVDRLVVYAQAADGDLETAMEIIDEEQKALEQVRR